MKPNVVFVFDRPFFRKFNREFKNLYGSQFDIKFISDFRFFDDVGFSDRFYCHLKNPNIENKSFDLDYESISTRCRYLRCQGPELQRKLINARWIAVCEIFEKYKPVACFNAVIDNYILDLMNLWMERKGTYILNPFPSLLPNLARCTTRGEFNDIREVEESEIDWAIAELEKKGFKARYVHSPRGPKQLFFLWAKEKIKKIVFETLKRLYRDPYNFHFNVIYPLASCPRVPRFGRVKLPGMINNIAKVEELVSRFSKIVFMPLQFTPEAALDYFISDKRFTNYEEVVSSTIKTLPPDALLIVKEHPDFYGFRSLRFYDQFLNRPNVILVSIACSTQELIGLSNFILTTGASSTGIEAVIQYKTVISLGGSYYANGGEFAHEIPNFDLIGSWPSYLWPIAIDKGKKRAFIKRVLQTTLPAGYDAIWAKKRNIEKTQKSVNAAMNAFLRKNPHLDWRGGGPSPDSLSPLAQARAQQNLTC